MMVNIFSIRWNEVEEDYAEFCLDLFDEKPVSLSFFHFSRYGISSLREKRESIFMFLERLYLSILRFVLVKKLLHDFDTIKVKKDQKAIHPFMKKRILNNPPFLVEAFNIVACWVSPFRNEHTRIYVGFT